MKNTFFSHLDLKHKEHSDYVAKQMIPTNEKLLLLGRAGLKGY